MQNRLQMSSFINKTTAQMRKKEDMVIQCVGGNTIGYEGDDKNIIKLISNARLINKLDKECCTEANDRILKNLTNAKATQVKDVYSKYLSSINLDKNFIVYVNDNIQNATAAKEYLKEKQKATTLVEQIDFASIFNENINKKSFNNFIQTNTINKSDLDANIKEGKQSFKQVGKLPTERTDIPEITIYNKIGKGRGVSKKGKIFDKKNNTEYILDDFGNFIRRYAYMEKNIYQLINFAEQGVISGQTQDIKRAAGMSILDIDPLDYGNEDFNSREKYIVEQLPQLDNEDLKKKVAIAYLHQWKGSGLRQRGVSLTATNKKDAVFGNAGESFRSDDGAKFKIDLALVKAYDPNNILLSHYHYLSPTRKETITDGEEENGKYKVKKYRYDESVIKNRELYLQYLPEEAVKEIYVHGDHGDTKYKSMSEFRQSDLYKNFIEYKNKGLSGENYSGDSKAESLKKGYEYGKLLKRSQEAARLDANTQSIKNQDELIEFVFKKTKLQNENSVYWAEYTKSLRLILKI